MVRRIDGPVATPFPADRPIAVRDLLTFRMGFGGYFGAVPGERRRRAAATERGSPQPSLPPEPDEWMRRFSTLPLMCQPGERGRYDTGSDVLGVLIAPASGRSFGAFLRERVFEPPAGDTDFSVPPGRPVRWNGGLGAIRRNDPTEQLVTILMTKRGVELASAARHRARLPHRGLRYRRLTARSA